MERVLLTGGAGYLGAVLVNRLLAADFVVTVLDNLSHGQPSLLQHAGHPRFEFVRGDVRDEALMRDLLRRHDVILPLAAIVGAKACDRDPDLAQAVNHESISMLNRLRGDGHRVVWPCTNSGYGTKSDDLRCTEETPLEPISVYGVTKVRAEEELLSRPETITLRLATVFGPSPRMRLDLLVNDFVYRAATDGFLVIYEKDFKRNYVHIDDVADCFLFCLENFDRMKGQPYNVGLDDANLSKAELAEKIKQHVPDLYVHFAEVGSDPDKRNYIVSNARLAEKGFAARRTLDEGISALLTVVRMLPGGSFAN